MIITIPQQLPPVVSIVLSIVRAAPFLIWFTSTEYGQQRAGPCHTLSCCAPGLTPCLMDVVCCAIHLHKAITDVACTAVRIVHQYGCAETQNPAVLSALNQLLSSMI